MIVIASRLPNRVLIEGVEIGAASPFRDRTQDMQQGFFYGYAKTVVTDTHLEKLLGDWWRRNEGSPLVRDGSIVMGGSDGDVDFKIMEMRKTGRISSGPHIQHDIAPKG